MHEDCKGTHKQATTSAHGYSRCRGDGDSELDGALGHGIRVVRNEAVYRFSCSPMITPSLSHSRLSDVSEDYCPSSTLPSRSPSSSSVESLQSMMLVPLVPISPSCTAMHVPTDAGEAPRRLPFVLERRLGKGNNGQVYLARCALGFEASNGASVSGTSATLRRIPSIPVTAACLYRLSHSAADAALCDTVGRERSECGVDTRAGGTLVQRGRGNYFFIAVKLQRGRHSHCSRETYAMRHVQSSCASVHSNSLPCPRLFFAWRLDERERLQAQDHLNGFNRCNGGQHRGHKRHRSISTVTSSSSRDTAWRVPAPPTVAVGMELCGPDLFDFTGKYRLYEDEVCYVALEMLRTLRAIHEVGVVHRSVKPENFCWSLGVVESGVALDFPLLIIDFGRSTVENPELRGRVPHPMDDVPYTGWWHSINANLAKPLTQKDDLMGIVHTVGYLLDDYISTEQDSVNLSSPYSSRCSSRSLSPMSMCDGDCSVNTSIDSIGRTPSNTRMAHRRGESSEAPRRHAYAECRRTLTDKILDTYDALRRRGRGPKYCCQGAGVQASEPRTISRPVSLDNVASPPENEIAGCKRRDDLNSVPRRTLLEEGIDGTSDTKRRARFRHIEHHYLPRWLPDKYYPDSLPEWWARWYAQCSTLCLDPLGDAETMATLMRNTLLERISGGDLGAGGTSATSHGASGLNENVETRVRQARATVLGLAARHIQSMNCAQYGSVS